MMAFKRCETKEVVILRCIKSNSLQALKYLIAKTITIIKIFS